MNNRPNSSQMKKCKWHFNTLEGAQPYSQRDNVSQDHTKISVFPWIG